jgi:hypothetical protein
MSFGDWKEPKPPSALIIEEDRRWRRLAEDMTAKSTDSSSMKNKP